MFAALLILALQAGPTAERGPTAADIARYYPEAAAKGGVEGRATLGCTIAANGLLEGCRVLEETPADQGFREAALRMSRLFKMRPTTRSGEPVAGGQVRIPIRFVLPEPELSSSRFKETPSPYEGALAFPATAAANGISGRAVLRCRVNAVGRLADCSVKDETPAGYGFGKAALSLRSKFRMRPVEKGADPWVDVPLNFDANRSLVIW
ncbi:TonB family protein [Phenylobacterium sp.]|jgi:TonB family protein|uniref:TonB family protein n=1 Tax=Phenylobacterium sp. TaxID=1871053 RepID=UPI002F9491AE